MQHGGAAGGGGYEFQAKVIAWFCCSLLSGHPFVLSRQLSFGRIRSVRTETGGPGDDVQLSFVDDERILEIQVKGGRLRSAASVSGTLLPLIEAVNGNRSLCGALIVSGRTSDRVWYDLPQVLHRASAGIEARGTADHWLRDLRNRGISRDALGRIDIVKLDFPDVWNGTHPAFAVLGPLFGASASNAWQILVAEGMRLIRLAGQVDAAALWSLLEGHGLQPEVVRIRNWIDTPVGLDKILGDQGSFGPFFPIRTEPGAAATLVERPLASIIAKKLWNNTNQIQIAIEGREQSGKSCLLALIARAWLKNPDSRVYYVTGELTPEDLAEMRKVRNLVLLDLSDPQTAALRPDDYVRLFQHAARLVLARRPEEPIEATVESKAIHRFLRDLLPTRSVLDLSDGAKPFVAGRYPLPNLSSAEIAQISEAFSKRLSLQISEKSINLISTHFRPERDIADSSLGLLRLFFAALASRRALHGENWQVPESTIDDLLESLPESGPSADNTAEIVAALVGKFPATYERFLRTCALIRDPTANVLQGIWFEPLLSHVWLRTNPSEAWVRARDDMIQGGLLYSLSPHVKHVGAFRLGIRSEQLVILRKASPPDVPTLRALAKTLAEAAADELSPMAYSAVCELDAGILLLEAGLAANAEGVARVGLRYILHADARQVSASSVWRPYVGRAAALRASEAVLVSLVGATFDDASVTADSAPAAMVLRLAEEAAQNGDAGYQIVTRPILYAFARSWHNSLTANTPEEEQTAYDVMSRAFQDFSPWLRRNHSTLFNAASELIVAPAVAWGRPDLTPWWENVLCQTASWAPESAEEAYDFWWNMFSVVIRKTLLDPPDELTAEEREHLALKVLELARRYDDILPSRKDLYWVNLISNAAARCLLEAVVLRPPEARIEAARKVLKIGESVAAWTDFGASAFEKNTLSHFLVLILTSRYDEDFRHERTAWVSEVLTRAEARAVSEPEAFWPNLLADAYQEACFRLGEETEDSVREACADIVQILKARIADGGIKLFAEIAASRIAYVPWKTMPAARRQNCLEILGRLLQENFSISSDGWSAIWGHALSLLGEQPASGTKNPEALNLLIVAAQRHEPPQDRDRYWSLLFSAAFSSFTSSAPPLLKQSLEQAAETAWRKGQSHGLPEETYWRNIYANAIVGTYFNSLARADSTVEDQCRALVGMMSRRMSKRRPHGSWVVFYGVILGAASRQGEGAAERCRGFLSMLNQVIGLELRRLGPSHVDFWQDATIDAVRRVLRIDTAPAKPEVQIAWIECILQGLPEEISNESFYSELVLNALTWLERGSVPLNRESLTRTVAMVLRELKKLGHPPSDILTRVLIPNLSKIPPSSHAAVLAQFERSVGLLESSSLP